ncbi:MAG: hypothetical protein V4669_13940 [Pseudomonadota bacterium]
MSALLFEHEGGRRVVTDAGDTGFPNGEPQWRCVGPVDATTGYDAATEIVLREARRLSGTSAAHCGGLLKAISILRQVHLAAVGPRGLSR